MNKNEFLAAQAKLYSLVYEKYKETWNATLLSRVQVLARLHLGDEKTDVLTRQLRSGLESIWSTDKVRKVAASRLASALVKTLLYNKALKSKRGCGEGGEFELAVISNIIEQTVAMEKCLLEIANIKVAKKLDFIDEYLQLLQLGFDSAKIAVKFENFAEEIKDYVGFSFG